jgi:hypothetical protein
LRGGGCTPSAAGSNASGPTGATVPGPPPASDAPAAAKGWVLINKVWGEPREIRLSDVAPEALGRGYRLFRVCVDRASQTGEPVRATVSLGRAEVAYVLPELSVDASPPPVIHE